MCRYSPGLVTSPANSTPRQDTIIGVATSDIGEWTDIHPRDKIDVALRLAQWALAREYGRQGLPVSGPRYQGMTIHGARIEISFTDAAGLHTRDDKAPASIQIAGADQQFVAAQAEIEHGKLRVWSDTVAHPVAVRFGWSDFQHMNLVNAAGLPAPAFRTDQW